MPAAPWSSFGPSNAPSSFHPRTRVRTSLLWRKRSMSTQMTRTPASSFVQAALAEQLKSKRSWAKGYQDTELNETLIPKFSPQHTDAVLRHLYKKSWYGTCLVVQWLRLHDPKTRGLGWIRDRRNRILHGMNILPPCPRLLVQSPPHPICKIRVLQLSLVLISSKSLDHFLIGRVYITNKGHLRECIHSYICTCMCMLWRRAWQPPPVFLPGESHGQRSPAGYSALWLQKSRTRLSDQAHVCIK